MCVGWGGFFGCGGPWVVGDRLSPEVLLGRPVPACGGARDGSGRRVPPRAVCNDAISKKKKKLYSLGQVSAHLLNLTVSPHINKPSPSHFIHNTPHPCPSHPTSAFLDCNPSPDILLVLVHATRALTRRATTHISLQLQTIAILHHRHQSQRFLQGSNLEIREMNVNEKLEVQNIHPRPP